MATTTGLKPTSLTIRAYQVGFGDCFLLTFFYAGATRKADKERHILIDFGTTGMPENVDPDGQMMRVARDIEERCDGKLHLVVASHRHKDHISGFATREDGSGTGDIIAGLKPEIVVQPWTENPKAKDPKEKLKATGASGQQEHSLQQQFVSALSDMNALSEAIQLEVSHLTSAKFTKGLNQELADQIRFLSDDNGLANKSAVENLATMGTNHYVNYGYELKVSRLLPGMNLRFLGPPTLEQHAEIKKQRATDKSEFWMLQAAAQQFWSLQAATAELIGDFTSGNTRLFPNADVFQDFFPTHNRWFIRQLRALRGDQMLRLVRILDKAMNNTSVILLLEVGGKKLLFPGDAQIENWEYALHLDKNANLKLLKDVFFYKVGHHGSRNATPKTLWNNFATRSADKKKRGRLHTMMSTMKGKHGHEHSHTEVPRATLVNELMNLSDYVTTEESALSVDLKLTFQG
jgi:hypothetical protein